ncbi:uncharacterized protein LOC144925314 [Branchiostoma floridae x Branchiostoma belcheri]
MGVDLCTYRARIGCFRNPAFHPLCCWQSCLLVWMVISQLMLKLAGDVEENPGPRQQYDTRAAMSTFEDRLIRKEWNIMGKRTLLTLDLFCEYRSSPTSLAQLPKEVFELKELEALDLTKNKNIDLSHQLTKLTNLKVLCLDDCDLKTVPAAVMKLPQLEMLILSNNRNITLPDEMSGLTNLTVLDLRYCNLDTLPSVVLKLTNLQVLDLSAGWNSILKISVPDELSKLNKLKVLTLRYRNLDTVPPAVLKLPQLEELDLSGNSGIHLPDGLAGLTNLRVLKLAGTDMETVPPAVQNLPQLEELDLSWNRGIHLPDGLAGLTNLRVLKLAETDMETVPPAVQNLPQLEELDLSFNSGIHLPDGLAGLTNIRVLKLQMTGMTTFPPVVWRLTQLEWLDLSHNQLQTLPAKIGQLTNVKHLVLSLCELRTLPPEVGRLAQLERLHLRGNQLKTLPAEIGQLTNVKHLDLSRCKLHTLPPEVGRLTQLEELDLSDNKLQALPAEVAQLSSAWHLVVDGNPLIKPPAEVCRYGIAAISQYFAELERSEEKISAHMKVVVLGEKMAGKTSLVRTLDSGKSTLTEVEDRTHCVEITQWAPDDNITFEVYDFGGHDVYHLTHQFFLTPDAFYLLLVNLQTYNCTEERYTEAVGFWLDTLNARVPGAVVSVVGSKEDLCQAGEVKAKTKDIQADETGASVETSPPEESQKPTWHWLTMADCAQLGQLAGLSAERLEPVLSYLQQVGTILRYTDIPELKDYVFHDPTALIELFKNLFHHDTSALFSTPRLSHFTFSQLSTFQSDLRDCGLIRKDVMACLLPPNVNPDIITALMQHFGLCFEVQATDNTDPSKHTHQYKIPWYLHKQIPEELMSVWPKDVPEDQEQLQLMCNITGFCPRGLFQRFSVGIHPLVKDRVDWKDGVMAYRQDYPVLVCSKPVADDTYITMATRGRLAQAGEMWGVVHPLLEVLVQLLQEWPGVLYSLHVTCAHCIKAGLDRPYQHELRDRTAQDGRDVRCPRVKKTASTSADLVYRPARFSELQRVKRSQDHVSKNPPEKWEEAAGTSAGTILPIILLISDEYGTSKGGISTINCEAVQTLKDKALVYATALRVPKEDQKAADRDGVTLIKPVQLVGKESEQPTLDWLTYYHKEHFPDLPKDVTCIIGHADITDTAARNIHDEYYKEADLIMFTHVIPEDTEHYKGGRKAIKAWEKEKDMLNNVNKAKAAFSVGRRIFEHFSTMYGERKKPQSHQIFLPKPSKIFLSAKVSPEGKQKVVLSIGRVRKVEKLKGHDLVGESMRDVVKRVANMRWCVRGISEDDWETSQKILEDALNSPDLNPTLRSYGTQEDIRDDMETAHLVLMPSRSEPFGLVGLEAIAAGIPVLISDKTGLADMILDLIKEKKLSPEHRNVIVETSVNDRDRAGDAKRWADRIVDVLEHSDSEFEKAAEFKRELVESRYWEESHNAFLQACGITAGAADQ